MRLNIFKNTTKVFGLEISDAGIRAIEFSSPVSGGRIIAFSDVALPRGVFGGDVILDKGSFTTRHVVVNLPESKCFVRVIHVQSMTEVEADSAIPFEAESYIPIPLDQVYLDWQKIGEVSGRMEVLLVACPKEYVDAHVAVLERAGLLPVALEVECQSISRVLVPQGSKDHMLIADIALSRTDLIIVDDGNIQFTSTIPIAGSVLTEAVARGLGLPPDKAEVIKDMVGVTESTEYPTVKTLLTPVLNNFVAEIKNILAFHDQRSSKPVTKLLLSGKGAQLKSLVEYMAGEFADRANLQISLADPWTNIHLSHSLPFPAEAGLSYVTALGLANRPSS